MVERKNISWKEDTWVCHEVSSYPTGKVDSRVVRVLASQLRVTLVWYLSSTATPPPKTKNGYPTLQKGYNLLKILFLYSTLTHIWLFPFHHNYTFFGKLFISPALPKTSRIISFNRRLVLTASDSSILGITNISKIARTKSERWNNSCHNYYKLCDY